MKKTIQVTRVNKNVNVANACGHVHNFDFVLYLTFLTLFHLNVTGESSVDETPV